MGRVEPDWEAEAYYYRYEDPESGEYVQLPMDEARDRLILDYLVQGDPRPLIHFLRSEHELGRNVRSYLADARRQHIAVAVHYRASKQATPYESVSTDRFHQMA